MVLKYEGDGVACGYSLPTCTNKPLLISVRTLLLLRGYSVSRHPLKNLLYLIRDS